jgi:uracil phosphoribosyltransferase
MNNSSLNILGNQNSLFNQFISEIRNSDVQSDSLRFRRNLERIGEIFAYEISKTLRYEEREIVTPLGIANIALLQDYPVLATILRAGLPLHQGMLNYFDKSQNAFITAFRKYEKDGTFEIEVDYLSSPTIDDKTLILADPMLATGQSMVLAYEEMLTKGDPVHTHFVSAIASRQGLEYLQAHVSPSNSTIWIGAVDEELTAHSYIVPGLGDAGDLAYGIKE